MVYVFSVYQLDGCVFIFVAILLLKSMLFVAASWDLVDSVPPLFSGWCCSSFSCVAWFLVGVWRGVVFLFGFFLRHSCFFFLFVLGIWDQRPLEEGSALVRKSLLSPKRLLVMAPIRPPWKEKRLKKNSRPNLPPWRRSVRMKPTNVIFPSWSVLCRRTGVTYLRKP